MDTDREVRRSCEKNSSVWVKTFEPIETDICINLEIQQIREWSGMIDGI